MCGNLRGKDAGVLKLVRQPKGTNQCGQACIATLAGITLEEAIDLVGTKGLTRTKQLRDALQSLGFYAGMGLRIGSPDGLAIVKFLSPDGRSHWVVWDGKYYDPQAGVFPKVPRYLEGSKQTSFLAVERP